MKIDIGSRVISTRYKNGQRVAGQVVNKSVRTFNEYSFVFNVELPVRVEFFTVAFEDGHTQEMLACVCHHASMAKVFGGHEIWKP